MAHITQTKSEPVVDIHVHLACVGDSGGGGKIAHKLRYSLPFNFMLLWHHILPWEVDDFHFQKRIVAAITTAQLVDAAVVLAFDAVYTPEGKPCPQATVMYTPNEVVMHLARQHPRILFGASVHPFRPDALEMLEMCKSNGAVLVKWLPSAQHIDPSDARHRRFYRKMAELGLPLLCHTSVEHMIPSHHLQHLNAPSRLEFPLSEGVTVIAAHSCLPAFPSDHDYFPDFLQLLHQAAQQRWNLYADVSAFCLPGRRCQIPRARKELPVAQLLLGSDFPVPNMPFVYEENQNPPCLPDHPLDLNVVRLRRMGFPQEVFTKAWRVLPIPETKRKSLQEE